MRSGQAEGYRLWLRYDRMEDPSLLRSYRRITRRIAFPAATPILRAARAELERGLEGLLGRRPVFLESGDEARASLLVRGPDANMDFADEALRGELEGLGPEGFLIASRASLLGRRWILASKGEAGILYAVFRLLRQAQCALSAEGMEGASSPRVALRMLDHWDNLDGTVERGYAGFSIWDWQRLPGYLPERYRDYARANASIGVNAAALTNVNADALVLSASYIEKAAALASVLRPYNIRSFLSARFSAPIELGGLPTADPADPAVAAWWRGKADEIYRAMPDFGGFLVKANSEGQPGPQDYGRSHAEGANLLAAALAPHGGLLIWRAFVYSAKAGEDRAKQAYEEFLPLDGAFLPNVLVQVKNGPIDFQPREPIHPLFGAMRRTPLALEFQITQEYLGFSAHLAYLAPLFSEVLRTDTFRSGPGSSVAKLVEGSSAGERLSCIAGVANTGSSPDWCGSHFAQANWYAFGRLAWDHSLEPGAIAEEWIRSSLTRNERAVRAIAAIMLSSREAVVDYMTPLGLVHLMGKDHHYGPAPWLSEGRPDWTSVYFHKADRDGIGFERGSAGSGAVSQYAPELRELYGDPASCPEEFILFFHRLGWDHEMRSGRSLWDELCLRYQRGVEAAASMSEAWAGLEASIDGSRFEECSQLLAIQYEEARWWKDACLSYFAGFSERPFPAGVEPPERELSHYLSITPRHVPGIGRIS